MNRTLSTILTRLTFVAASLTVNLAIGWLLLSNGAVATLAAT